MLALIDGDVIAYLACKSRHRSKDGHVMVSLEGPYAREFTPEEDAQYLEDSWKEFKKILVDLTDSLWATDYLMAVKGEDNFRNEMYPEYKVNRHKDASKSNIFVPILREMAVTEGLAIASTGREADDLLRIWAEEARVAGHEYVIVSIDKDLKCIPGHHYNIKKSRNGQTEEVSELFATRFFYQQLLQGDPTDNIPGVPKIGPIKAEKYLYNCNTEEEMQEIVVEQYLNAFGDEWFEYLLSNGKMLYLQRSCYDYFAAMHWPVVQFTLEQSAKLANGVPETTPDALAAPLPWVAPSAPATPLRVPKLGKPATPEIAQPIVAAAPKKGVPKLTFK